MPENRSVLYKPDVGGAHTNSKSPDSRTFPLLPSLRSQQRQAAFRGYRLRERLRTLPAREAECTIKALRRNSDGFRRLGMYLVFYLLYFAVVFTGFDIKFERAVVQGLRGHTRSVSENASFVAIVTSTSFKGRFAFGYAISSQPRVQWPRLGLIVACCA